jgi:AcrR family transcriptional regulator
LLNNLAKKNHDNQTETAILGAARKVFTQKGFAAARMEDIAQEAKINRALLHYYFRTKDRMFDIIFEQRIGEFFSGLAGIISSDIEFEEKVAAIISHDIDMISAQPDLPIFIMQELAQHPVRLVAYAEKAGAHPGSLIKIWGVQLRNEVDKKRIRPTDPSQLLINIMSLSIYPFIAKPMIKAMQGVDDSAFHAMMKKRKKEVADFVLRAIKP